MWSLRWSNSTNEWPQRKAQFLAPLASSAFEAATNIVVKKANREMLFYVYGAVILLCMLTFRSVPGVVCAVLPLMLTSILCEALMVWLGIGVEGCDAAGHCPGCRYRCGLRPCTH